MDDFENPVYSFCGKTINKANYLLLLQEKKDYFLKHGGRISQYSTITNVTGISTFDEKYIQAEENPLSFLSVF